MNYLLILGLFASVYAAPNGDGYFDTNKVWTESEMRMKLEDMRAEMTRSSNSKGDWVSAPEVGVEGNEYRITKTLPGFDEKDIIVETRVGLLKIQAQHGDKIYIDEGYLPNTVNVTGTWTFDEGILKIVFPLKKGVETTNVESVRGFSTDFTTKQPIYDREDVEESNNHEFGWFANPIFSSSGDYPPVMRAQIDANSARQGYPRSRLPVFTAEEVKMIRGSFDFMGLNHYTTNLVKPGKRNMQLQASFDDDLNVNVYQKDEWPKSNSTWLRIVPWGFRRALNWIKTTYNNPMIMVTENGVSTKPGLNDKKRIQYIDSYLRAMHDAITKDKCNVRAYTYWSLIDNFEWMRGYSERFGLCEVDYKSANLTRTRRTSFSYYKFVATTGCLPVGDYTYNKS